MMAAVNVKMWQMWKCQMDASR